MFLTRGWPTVRGSTLIDAAGPWEEDAPAVARLRESGAAIIGKTTTPEFAWKGVTDSRRHGVTGNPWGAGWTSGGSSGGSATAVGLGMGAWSIGTDGGGSVRIPASFTGTTALKPTFGRMPMFPPSPYGTLSHGGPMTRTVADAALLLDVVSGPDSRDWAALAPPAGSYVAALDDDAERSLRGLRVALSPTLGYGRNDPEVEAAVVAAAGVLADAGAHVEQVDPGIDDCVDAFHVLWFTGAAKVVAAHGPDALAEVDPLLARCIEAYGLPASASDYLDAMAVRMALGVRMGAFHEQYDVLLTPTMPIPAFAAGQDAPDGWRERPVDVVVAVHVPLQHDPAAGAVGAVRLHRRPASGRAAAGGRPPRGRAAAPRRRRLPAAHRLAHRDPDPDHPDHRARGEPCPDT